jgi:hypothetical protein
MKTKPMGHVQVILDDNNELIAGDNVFQLDELVNPYQVALSNDLEKKINFLRCREYLC